MRIKLAKGDILICIDEDSEDEDLGMSGIVLKGNRDLTLGKEYKVESINEQHVPKEKHKNSSWKNDPLQTFHNVQDYWVMVDLIEVETKKYLPQQWLHNFKKK